jgi:prolyl-tRNA synthetase
VFVGRRDKGPKEKQSYPQEDFAAQVPSLLQAIQDAIYEKALAFRREQTKTLDSKDEFYAFFTPKNGEKPEIHGGFALAHWNGSAEVEAKIKEDLKVTIRCIPFEENPEPGTCIFTGEPSTQRVVFAKSY